MDNNVFSSPLSSDSSSSYLIEDEDGNEYEYSLIASEAVQSSYEFFKRYFGYNPPPTDLT